MSKNNKTKQTDFTAEIKKVLNRKVQDNFCRGTDFPRSRNGGRNSGKAYLKRNSRFSAKSLLITSKKHTLLSKQTFQRYFENRNGRYLTTLIFVSVTPN